MKNVTLSIPEEILTKSREYAKLHGTTLNEMIRQFLKVTVNEKQGSIMEAIEDHLEEYGVNTKGVSLNREDLYER